MSHNLSIVYVAVAGSFLGHSELSAQTVDSSRSLQACGQGRACALSREMWRGRRRETIGAKRLEGSSSLGNTQPDAMFMRWPDDLVKVHKKGVDSLACIENARLALAWLRHKKRQLASLPSNKSLTFL